MLKFAYLFMVLAPAFAWAGVVGETVHYTCDRGASVYATYVIAEDDSSVVLAVEGQQVALAQQISASGAKYGPPEGEPGYIWWTKGDEATLYAQGKTPDEDVSLASCMAVRQD